MTQEPEHDVVIVGGRVAGASLAILLARQGRDVVVLDRDRFPSDTLSTHYVSAVGVGRLAQLGALDGLLEAGFRRITRARTYVDDCILEGPALSVGPGFGMAPRRDILDALLQQCAVEAGADVRTLTSVDGLVEEDGRVAGVVVDGRELRARVVVGADGKSSKVARWVGAETYREVPPARAGYYGYYRGVRPLVEPAVEIIFVGDTVAFLFPMRPGEDCLAMEVPNGRFEEFRSDPQGTFERVYRSLPGMADRLADAVLEDRIMGTKGIPNHFRVPFGPGWALTGDAAYLKDPITGLGIGDALSQSFLLADALGAALDGADWTETMSAYQAQRDEALLPLFDLTIDALETPTPPVAELDRLRGVLANPFTARSVSYWLPDNLEQVLDPGRQALVQLTARGFAAQREPQL